jgi:DUF1680 family protein
MHLNPPLQLVPLHQVHIRDPFWSPRLEVCRERTLPHVFRQCEATGRIGNFARAAGRLDGPHQGIYYDDSDVFKVIEGAAYALQINPDPDLETYLDDLIEQIAAAQEPDGYLYTARTVNPDQAPDGAGPERWSNLRASHELYNLGHLYEAAVAVHQATSKRGLLEVALRSADLVAAEFGPQGRRDVPGHQEIELGLMRLYRHTGERKYLDLARFFLDERGRPDGRALYGEYAQDHLPVCDQHEAVGHAVRAGYLYAAMVDLTALTGDSGYAAASQRIWQNVAGRKLALTGGMGARRGNEGFGADYELPTLTAYNETCAAVANILWNQRLFLLSGESRYIDVLERALYNGFLAGAGLDGETFFYFNPLASAGRNPFNPDLPLARRPWFRTACCPTNVVRLLLQLGGLVYALGEAELFVNLYIGGEMDAMVGGAGVRVEQESRLPWQGRVRFEVRVAKPAAFALKLRIPHWAQGQPLPGGLYRYLDEAVGQPSLKVDGKAHPLEIENGYAVIRREWRGTVQVDLDLPMPVRRVAAHPRAAELAGKIALERGPLVYAFEGADNPGGVLERRLPEGAVFSIQHQKDLLGGVTVIEVAPSGQVGIPYYAWGHRGVGEMAVWLEG